MRKAALASRARDAHARVEREQRRGEIGRRDRDAVARLEAVLAVIADLRVAGVAAGEPARQVGVAEVPAAHVLRQIARDRALIAQLRRRGLPGRLRERGVAPGHARVGRDVGHARRGADDETPARVLDRVAEQPAHVDEVARRLAAALQRHEVGAAGERLHAGRSEQRERLVERAGAGVGAHPARASRKRRRVIGDVRTRTPVAW